MTPIRPERFEPFAVVSLLFLVVLAGCGSGPGSITAGANDPATIDPAALDATGYQRDGSRNFSFNTTVRASISGDVEMSATQKVFAEIRVVRFYRNTDAGPAGVSLASSPAVHPIEDQSLTRDPLAVVPASHQINYVQATYAGLTNLSKVENTTVTLLGNETTLQIYEATGVRTGRPTRLTVYLASVRDGSDYVTLVGVVPRDADERDRILRLVEAVRHEKE